jgi:hypothetical protein
VDGGGVFPVFALPQAHAIADHLLAWAEDRPGDWFTLCYAERNSRYVAVLIPNLAGSVERFEAAHLVRHGELSKAASYELLFRPIAFVSNTGHTFGRVRKLLARSSMAGFVEPGDFDPAAPTSLDLDRIRRVGPFPVCWDATPFGFEVTAILIQLTESAGDPEGN